MRRLLPLIIALVLIAVSPVARAAAVSGSLAAIEQDFERGELTLDERVLLQIRAIKNPESLPPEYAEPALSASVEPSRCITTVLLDIRQSWDDLAATTRQVYLASFARASTEFTFVSPGGYYVLHYDTLGEDPVPAEDLDFDNVPDFIERCAAYLDTARAFHLDRGYLMPPSDGELGGDSLYDIYFEDLGSNYGYTVPEGQGSYPWNDVFSYVVLHNDFLGFSSPYDPEGDQAGAAKATCAHEFHHAVQFAYDPGEDLWWIELDATHVEDLVYDHTDDNYGYLPGFFNYPEKSLMENTGHAYSSFIYGIFLAEWFDTSLQRAAWEGARYTSIFTALTDTLMGRYGWTMDSAAAEFAVWNYITDTRDDGLHYGETYPYSVKIGRSHSNYPVNLLTSPYNPAGYGSCYLSFYPGSLIGKLRITVNGEDARQWAAHVIKSTAENQHEVERVVLADGSYYGQIEIPNFQNYTRVTLVVTNVAEFSSAGFFSYSAQVIPPYEVASSPVTIDSAVYSGGERDFECLISNVSPLSDVLHVTAVDDSGWVAPDTLVVSLSPEQDSIVALPVRPPEGTPLGRVSNITFRVWSNGNPAVTDSAVTAAMTVLQRSDLDFNGRVRVDDITYLVNYLFKAGVDPIPVIEAGDANCDDRVNVNDLTAIVDHLFKGGDASPCNPY